MMQDTETASRNSTAKRKSAPKSTKIMNASINSPSSLKTQTSAPKVSDLQEQDFTALFDSLDDLDTDLVSLRKAAQTMQKSSGDLRRLLTDQEKKP